MRGMTEIYASNLSIEELQKEIDERRALIRQMVGNLYPLVLGDEIIGIQAIISKKAV